MDNPKKHGAYGLIPSKSVLSGHNIVSTKRVFKVKADSIHKARVMVQGWGQVPGFDCGCTFDQVYSGAPVGHPQSQAELIWEVLQLHVMTGLLNANE